MLDTSRALDDEDRVIIDAINDKKYIALLNKVDLECKLSEEVITSLNRTIEISAKTGFGIENLKEEIKNLFFNGEIDSESLIISNTRHKQALYW